MKIYIIRNSINGKIYVGKTTRSLKARFEDHARGRKGCGLVVHKAIEKYGAKNFTISILLDGVPEPLLNANEINAIKVLKSNDPKIGYNRTRGGDGRLGGWTASEETRKKMSKAHSGRKNHFYGKHHSKRVCRILREVNLGRHRPPDPGARERMLGNTRALGSHRSRKWRKAMSRRNSGSRNPMFGRHLSKSSRQKIRQANLGNQNARRCV